jgi:hypothetical protein
MHKRGDQLTSSVTYEVQSQRLAINNKPRLFSNLVVQLHCNVVGFVGLPVDTR